MNLLLLSEIDQALIDLKVRTAYLRRNAYDTETLSISQALDDFVAIVQSIVNRSA